MAVTLSQLITGVDGVTLPPSEPPSEPILRKDPVGYTNKATIARLDDTYQQDVCLTKEGDIGKVSPKAWAATPSFPIQTPCDSFTGGFYLESYQKNQPVVIVLYRGGRRLLA